MELYFIAMGSMNESKKSEKHRQVEFFFPNAGYNYFALKLAIASIKNGEWLKKFKVQTSWSLQDTNLKSTTLW